VRDRDDSDAVVCSTWDTSSQFFDFDESPLGAFLSAREHPFLVRLGTSSCISCCVLLGLPEVL
jgi:hypothetical protein